MECLLAHGANPNAQNNDGQTPLHIAINRYITQTLEDASQNYEADPQEFEDLKRVVKELPFNGADRDIKGRFVLSQVNTRLSREIQELTPLELLQQFKEELPESLSNQYELLSKFLVRSQNSSNQIIGAR